MEKTHGAENRITGDTGKTVDGERVAEGPAVAVKRGREAIRKELQGNEAAELGVLSFIDDAHAATTEFFQNAVVRNGLADE